APGRTSLGRPVGGAGPRHDAGAVPSPARPPHRRRDPARTARLPGGRGGGHRGPCALVAACGDHGRVARRRPALELAPPGGGHAGAGGRGGHPAPCTRPAAAVRAPPPDRGGRPRAPAPPGCGGTDPHPAPPPACPDRQAPPPREDRKSTRLNSSHVKISYGV